MRQLAERRRALGLTQQDVADVTGKAQSTVSGWETGTYDPALLDVEDYARLVGCWVTLAPRGQAADGPGATVWSWTPPAEPGPHVRRVRPVERYPGDNGIWFDREPDGSGWRLVVNNRRGDAALEWLQVVAAAGQVYGGRRLVDATAEREVSDAG